MPTITSERNQMKAEKTSDTKNDKICAKGGWIAAITILVITAGIIAGLMINSNNQLAKKDEEIANLKENKNSSLAGFDIKIDGIAKAENDPLYKGDDDDFYWKFEKIAVSKDGKYIFAQAGVNSIHSLNGGAMAQYYRSTDNDGVWKYYSGGNAITGCNKFDKERIEIAKNYASEFDLINICQDDSLETHKVSEL